MKFSLVAILALILIDSACVPIRREMYVKTPNTNNLQEGEVYASYTQDPLYEYELRPNDVISIKVASSTASEFNFLSYQNDQQMGDIRGNDPLLSGFDIGTDGTIFMPVIGKIEVAGLSLDEAREKIRQILSEYLESPTVDIKLLSFRVTVIGEVENEQTFVVYNPRISLLDAIARAGGMTDFADPTLVKIVRNNISSLEVAYVNVLEEDLLTSPYYYLRPDDVVTVASVPSKNLQEYNLKYLQLLLSGLTAIGIFFNIFRN